MVDDKLTMLPLSCACITAIAFDFLDRQVG
jgi:hypothetical protein